jgi:hypothetical protein
MSYVSESRDILNIKRSQHYNKLNTYIRVCVSECVCVCVCVDARGQAGLNTGLPGGGT